MIALGIDVGGSSVKAALLEGDRLVATGRSAGYERPDAGQIAAAVRESMSGEIASALGAAGKLGALAVGLCAPGVFDARSRTITLAVNMPGLVGVNLDAMVAGALPGSDAQVAPVVVVTDAHAAAFDCWSADPFPGRLLAISLGTGVGACVLDDGVPLMVTGRSCGHLGQVDVSLADEAAPLGPDGGRGSLEAYIGLAALRRRFADAPGGVEAMLARLTADDPAALALVRGIRIAHAIYRPDRIVLLGGVGIRLAHLTAALHEAISRDLTRLARPGWRLDAGRHDWHAAAGAARLATGGGSAPGTAGAGGGARM